MSVALLRQPNCKIQGLSDDLESILWILLFHILRYRPTSITPANAVESLVEDIFDQYRDPGNDNDITGGSGKTNFLKNEAFTTKEIHASTGLPVPLQGLLKALRKPFQTLRPMDPDDEDEIKKMHAMEKLSTDHAHILSIFDKFLGATGWFPSDAGVDQIPLAETRVRSSTIWKHLPLAKTIRQGGSSGSKRSRDEDATTSQGGSEDAAESGAKRQKTSKGSRSRTTKAASQTSQSLTTVKEGANSEGVLSNVQ
ncbi:hypothetical protein OF83DRAFT_1170227 [Amylostereum chailletii]|nr:hypothetical protein OF83DRAFT_1170227 [Amylostereum chailletii]